MWLETAIEQFGWDAEGKAVDDPFKSMCQVPAVRLEYQLGAVASLEAHVGVYVVFAVMNPEGDWDSGVGAFDEQGGERTLNDDHCQGRRIDRGPIDLINMDDIQSCAFERRLNVTPGVSVSPPVGENDAADASFHVRKCVRRSMQRGLDSGGRRRSSGIGRRQRDQILSNWSRPRRFAKHRSRLPALSCNRS